MALKRLHMAGGRHPWTVFHQLGYARHCQSRLVRPLTPGFLFGRYGICFWQSVALPAVLPMPCDLEQGFVHPRDIVSNKLERHSAQPEPATRISELYFYLLTW